MQSNEGLTKERDELRQEIEKLRWDQADNVKIIENLCATIEKDAKTIAEQMKGMFLMGPELEEKMKYIDGAEAALKGKFTELYEEYKASLLPFSAEPLPYPGDGNVVEIFEWLKREFESLPGVIAGLNDYAVSFCLNSTLQLLEKQDCDHSLALAEDGYVYPSASKLGAEEKSRNVKTTKLRIFRQLWTTFRQEYIQQLAREQLECEKEKAVKLEVEDERDDDAGTS